MQHAAQNLQDPPVWEHLEAICSAEWRFPGEAHLKHNQMLVSIGVLVSHGCSGSHCRHVSDLILERIKLESS